MAAVRGALWARTDREATYLLTIAVQQGLVTPAALGTEILRAWAENVVGDALRQNALVSAGWSALAA